MKISEENPFEFDALNRKENADVLTQFIMSTNEPLVLALNSPWGTGKTTFIKMWEKYLQLSNFKTMSFNVGKMTLLETQL